MYAIFCIHCQPLNLEPPSGSLFITNITDSIPIFTDSEPSLVCGIVNALDAFMDPSAIHQVSHSGDGDDDERDSHGSLVSLQFCGGESSRF